MIILFFILILNENVLSRYRCVDQRKNETITESWVKLIHKWQYFAEAPNIIKIKTSLPQNYTYMYLIFDYYHFVFASFGPVAINVVEYLYVVFFCCWDFIDIIALQKSFK